METQNVNLLAMHDQEPLQSAQSMSQTVGLRHSHQYNLLNTWDVANQVA